MSESEDPSRQPSRPCLLVDWGTSSLRGVVMDSAGQVCERIAAPHGILFTGGRSFADIYAESFGPWLARFPDMVALAAGMIGSRQGWAEAAYVPCPASFEELGRAIRYVDTGLGPLGIVPGVSADRGGVPDVMRGEEVQIFGAMPAANASCAVVLPGTHSKWVDVEAGRIAGFRTFMTGELFGLLRGHSILGRLMTADDGARPLNGPAFDAGCAASLNEGGTLLHALFGVRTLGLFDRLTSEAAPDYLSGLLIGEEVREALAVRPIASGEIHIVGRGDLAERYTRALASAGVTALTADADAGFRGMFRLASASGLISETHA